MIRRRVGRVAVPLGYWEAPASLALGDGGCTPHRQSDRTFSRSALRGMADRLWFPAIRTNRRATHKDTRRGFGAEIVPAIRSRASHRVRPHTDVRGPGGNRTCLAMYSAPAVECVFTKIDEVLTQRRYGALPLELRPSLSVNRAGGTRTLNHRVVSHVLRIGSRSLYSVATNGWPETAARESNPPPDVEDARARLTHATSDVLQPAVAVSSVLPKVPNEGYSRSAVELRLVTFFSCYWFAVILLLRQYRKAAQRRFAETVPLGTG